MLTFEKAMAGAGVDECKELNGFGGAVKRYGQRNSGCSVIDMRATEAQIGHRVQA